MSENVYRAETAPMDCSTKEALFRDNHPLIRELRRIPEILLPDAEVPQDRDILPLKELFLKKNMDLYHVDCLVLYKIARNMLRIQRKLAEIPVFPGLYDLEDILVNLRDSGFPVFLLHPEKFQLLEMEQDYEWYPEDERVFGERSFFDGSSQRMADQRLLYKILTASTKGNVKVPPRATAQDYSILFYGTLPAMWKDVFRKEILLTSEQWEKNLEEAIRMEESYERLSARRGNPEEWGAVSPEPETEETQEIPASGKEIHCLFVILRGERTHSLEMSRMLYETQDVLELEQEHGRFHLFQGFIYGDGVVKQKDFREYPRGFRVQIPHVIREYSPAEALLVASEWMADLVREDADSTVDRSFRMYILSDGRIANDSMYKACLEKLSCLKKKQVQIQLIPGKDSRCEGWDQLKRMIGEE